MAFMDWSDTLSVNIKEIDEQHKKLLAMVNELHEAMKTGRGKEVTEKTLSGLIQYVGTHFANEEALMEKHNYPGFLAHKGEHVKLTTQAKDIHLQFQQGKAVVNVELMNFLKSWLQNHILGTDKKYAPFLNGKGVK
jgi:hemerythrin